VRHINQRLSGNYAGPFVFWGNIWGNKTSFCVAPNFASSTSSLVLNLWPFQLRYFSHCSTSSNCKQTNGSHQSTSRKDKKIAISPSEINALRFSHSPYCNVNHC